MKAIILLLLPLSMMAQPKHTTEIIVEGVTFTQCMHSLTDAGYFPDKISPEYGTITTMPKQAFKVNGFICNVVLQIHIKDSIAYITGVTNSNISASSQVYEKIQNRSITGSLWKKSFNEMNYFALSLNGMAKYR